MVACRMVPHLSSSLGVDEREKKYFKIQENNNHEFKGIYQKSDYTPEFETQWTSYDDVIRLLYEFYRKEHIRNHKYFTIVQLEDEVFKLDTK